MVHNRLVYWLQVTPKFCKQYASVGSVIEEALSAYRDEVMSQTFPSEIHTPYRIDQEHTAVFLEALEKRGLHAAAEAASVAASKDIEAGEPPIKTPAD
jgi:3-methyl-2-oxobutanoate hydroxymethyltransferase